MLYEATVAQTRLTADVDRQFRSVLRRRATTFAKDFTDLGFCPVLQHDVDTGDLPPIKQSPRRFPLSAGTAEDEILDDMLKTGVIEPSTSEWASPFVLLRNLIVPIVSVSITNVSMLYLVRMGMQSLTSRTHWIVLGVLNGSPP